MIRKPSAEQPVVLALLSLMLAVFVAFLVIGAAMPVLPLHVHDTLGFGLAMVGSVAGPQFAAALVARIWSGRAADRRGAKWAVIASLGATACAGPQGGAGNDLDQPLALSKPAWRGARASWGWQDVPPSWPAAFR